MLRKRLIPCLDVDKGRVVKGVNFVDIKDAGDPVELAYNYYMQGADEICFLDITASTDLRKATYEIISETARNIFIPLTVGGGVSSVQDADKLLKASADKVGVNSSAIRNPDLIKEISNNFGAQCMVAAIDVKKTFSTKSGWEVFVKGGREATGIDAHDWILKVVDLGAGEILLTSMDADGTRKGYDLEITKFASLQTGVPVIASGGAGSVEHIDEVFKKGEADAALLASILHFGTVTIKDALKNREFSSELVKIGYSSPFNALNLA
jgi:imidazole glycerol-phosphate synthase subunit HisF